MRTSTAWQLGRPGAPADRSRFVLVAGATALAAALLLVAARIARLVGDSDQGLVLDDHGRFVAADSGSGGLAPYLTQSGLRPGVVLGAVLMAVPVLALGVQALRLGSVARERRLASFRLAGATPGDVRRVAAVEAGAAAAVGGLLAGPVYVVLWLLLGVLPSYGMRLVPTPGWLDVPVWLGAVVVVGLAGAVSGSLLQGRALVDPLGARVRRPAPRPGRSSGLAVVLGLVVLAAGLYGVSQGHAAEMAAMSAAVVGLLLAAFAGAPRLVARRGRSLACGRGVANLLAGRRLTDDPRTTGRVAAVLAMCGVVLGIEAVGVYDLVVVDADHLGSDLSFYLTGYGLAAAGVVVAVVVAAATLLVGVADQLTDARRPLAALRALGADEHVLMAAMRRQQTAAAGPAVVTGVVIGSLAYGLLVSDIGQVTPAIVAAAVVAWLGVHGTTRLAVRTLRSRLRAATDPENLRVA